MSKKPSFTATTSTAPPEKVTLADFRAYMPSHQYVFMPCREMWTLAAVNSRLGRIPVLNAQGRPKISNGRAVTISASAWLDQNQPVEQMLWAPGFPALIPDRLCVDGGWFDRKGVTCLNLYRPPRIELGDKTKAEPWIEHAHRVFNQPGDGDHCIKWLAHRVQRPEIKINHALVMGGCQGIGKDTLLEPIKYAIGPWNFHEASPSQMIGRFNSFIKSVILRVNEARDLGEVNRFSFYDHLKVFTAAPPDVLRCDEKHLREHYVFNTMGVIVSTNHKSDGIYLPADDRRHFVAWSPLTSKDFERGYFKRIWKWYAAEGYQHVAAYLSELDISDFDPKEPPPKTNAFWDIVNASHAPEEDEIADALDKLRKPLAVTLGQLSVVAPAAEWLLDRRTKRAIPYRMERCGYVPVRNPQGNEGRWVINETRQTIYCRAGLSLQEQTQAARNLKQELEQSKK
jgi:hypothetical protein